MVIHYVCVRKREGGGDWPSRLHLRNCARLSSAKQCSAVHICTEQVGPGWVCSGSRSALCYKSHPIGWICSLWIGNHRFALPRICRVMVKCCTGGKLMLHSCTRCCAKLALVILGGCTQRQLFILPMWHYKSFVLRAVLGTSDRCHQGFPGNLFPDDFSRALWAWHRGTLAHPPWMAWNMYLWQWKAARAPYCCIYLLAVVQLVNPPHPSHRLHTHTLIDAVASHLETPAPMMDFQIKSELFSGLTL